MLSGDSFSFPEQLQEKFERIKFGICFLQHQELLRRGEILRGEYQLKRFEKERINFFSQGIARRFSYMLPQLVPKFIT